MGGGHRLGGVVVNKTREEIFKYWKPLFQYVYRSIYILLGDPIPHN